MDFHVVDDEPSIVQIIVAALTKAGYSAEGFGSANDYLARLQHGELTLPKGIITDVCMPDMSGRQLMRAIREINPEQRFVVMSGYTDQTFGDQDACMYLSKPFRIPEMIKMAEAIIGCVGDGPSAKHGCATLGNAVDFVVTWKCPTSGADSES